MGASILFLGTGGDAIVVGKQLRASGGTLLFLGDKLILIDPGPGSLVRLKEQGVNVGALDIVLVSHKHLNHSHDVPAVLSAMTYGGLDRKGVLIGEESYLARHKSRRKPDALTDAADVLPGYDPDFYFQLAEKILVLAPGKKEFIGNLTVAATPVVHSSPGIGFKITGDGITVAYTGDTEYFEGMEKEYQNVDVLIINCKHPGKETFSMGAPDAQRLIQRGKPHLAILTHFGVKMLEADPFKLAADIQRETKVQVVAAHDGLNINLEHYLMPRNQKSLDAFMS